MASNIPPTLDRVIDVIKNPANIEAMIAISRRGRPAVQAIGKQIAAIAADLDDTEKQHIGRQVRDQLALRGWRPTRKARVATGHFFSWGAVYSPNSTESPRPIADGKRMDKLREMVRDLPSPPPSVDEFLGARKEVWGI